MKEIFSPLCADIVDFHTLLIGPEAFPQIAIIILGRWSEVFSPLCEMNPKNFCPLRLSLYFLDSATGPEVQYTVQ